MTYDDPADSGQVLAIIAIVYGVAILVSLLFLVAYYIVMSLALSKFFRKVGVESWIAWIPVYSSWKWLEVGGFPGWLTLLSFIPGASIVVSVFLYMGMWRTGIAFRKDAGFLVLGIFLPFVWLFMLGGRETEYHPEYISMAGFPPPIAGYGSVPRPPGSPIF